MSDRESGPVGVRPAAVSGTWYPSEARQLTSQIEVMLEGAGLWKANGRLRALIAPHAGLRYSGPTAAYGYACIEPRSFERVIVLAPSHRGTLRGAALDPSSHYETPLGRMPVDQDAVMELDDFRVFACSPKPFEREHAIEMQVPFLQHCLPDAKLLPILVGELRGSDFDEVAAALSSQLEEHTLLVVSSDFLHYGPNYGYVPFTENVAAMVRNTDQMAIDAIMTRDFDRFQNMLAQTEATICGRRPLGVFLLLAPRSWKSELRSYTTSGEISGDYTNSVSYASLVFCDGGTETELWAEEAERLVNQQPASASAPAGLGRSRVSRTIPVGESRAGQDTEEHSQRLAPVVLRHRSLTPSERRTLLVVARRSLEAELEPEGEAEALRSGLEVTSRLEQPNGAFVSLHRRSDGRLRGCIGSLEARRPLWATVAESTRGAAERDPRFEAITAPELAEIEIEISVLGPLCPVPDPRVVRVGRDGLVISWELKRGVLLPQVPECFGWGREEFLENLCHKAGLPPGAWRTGADLWRFEAEVFSENDLASPS